jgi:hypothetical protein
MALVYKKSSTNDEYIKFINEMKQGSKKNNNTLFKDLNIHSKKYCFMTKG